jgi:hypothetical protein
LRDTTYSIEIIAEANDSLDDTLDDIAEEVEDILGENEFLTDAAGDPMPYVERLALTMVEIGLVSLGEKIVGSLRISVEVPFKEEFPRSKIAEDLDEFETADVQYETGAGHAGAEAHDRLDLRP